jgi:hypothetical protein
MCASPFGTASIFVFLLAFSGVASTTLSSQDRAAETTSADAKGEIPDFESLIKTLRDPKIRDKEREVAFLAEYLDRSDEFVEPLSALLIVKNEVNERTARAVFRLLGKNAVAPIEKMFEPEKQDTEEGNARWRMACSAINATGEPARDAFESRLIEVLEKSSDPNARIPAVYALAGFDGGSPGAIEKALPDLEHPDFNVTLQVIRLIDKTGPGATVALDRVKKMFVEGNLNQRTWSAIALASIGPAARYNPYPEIRPLLDEFFLVKKERGLQAIGKLGSAAVEAEPRVREMMADDGSNTEAIAAFVLWQITGKSEEAIARLQETAATTELKLVSYQYLGDMGPAAEAAIPFLIEESRSGDYSIVVACVESLARIDRDNPEVDKRLAELESHPDPVVRLAVREANNRTAR